MNEQLQQALADILLTLKAGAEVGADVAARELPLLVQEYLTWGLWQHGMTAVGLFVLFCAAVWIARWGVLAMRKNNWDAGFPMLMLGVVVGIAANVAAFDEVSKVIQVIVAPRVYLLEQLANLVG